MKIGQVYYVIPISTKEDDSIEENSLLGTSRIGLRRGLVEGENFRVVSTEEWNEWKKNHHNSIEIPRFVIQRGSGTRVQNIIEIYPILAKIYYWSNGITQALPVQLTKGVNLSLLLSESMEISQLKGYLWTQISSRYHEMFPHISRATDKPGYKRENEASWLNNIHIRAKRLDNWITIVDSNSTENEDANSSRVLGDLNLTIPIANDDDEESCIILLETSYLNSNDPSDPRNSNYYMSNVESEGWRSMLSIGDYVDAKDTSGVWYESQVVDEDNSKNRVKIHYLGWAEKWDTWFAKDASQLQFLHSVVSPWRTKLIKGSEVEYCDGPIRGLKGDYKWAIVHDIQIMEDDIDDMDDTWPPLNPTALYNGKIIRLRLLLDGKVLQPVEANSEHLCSPGTHLKRKKTLESTSITGITTPNYSSSSSSYIQSTKSITTSYYGNSYSTRHGKPEFEGVVGLQNLGNTCFLNSILQCLSNSIPLLDYFNKKDENGNKLYEKEINQNNPLGMQGRLAKSFANLLDEMWSGEKKIIIPSEFKRIVGDYAPAFSGYSQHDSQEVLSFILDGIHEDLNRVLNKPKTNSIEHAGRPDDIVAKEEWLNYKKRNDSIITDHFMAQLRSHVTCPSCQHESITFDPSMILSVPIPTQVWITLLFIGINGIPIEYGFHVPKAGVYNDVKMALSNCSGVSTERILLVHVDNHRITRSCSDSIDIGEMIQPHQQHNIIAYELELPLSRYEIRSPNLYTLSSASQLDINQDSPGEIAFCLIAIQHKLPSESILNPMDHDTYDEKCTSKYRRVEWNLFELPQLVTITRDASCGDISCRIHQLTEHIISNDFNGIPYHIHISNSRVDGYLEKNINEKSTESLSHEITRGSFTFTLEWTKEGYNYGYKKIKQKIIHENEIEKSIDLKTCIRKFTEKEQLGENDTWYCPKCKNHVRAYKKFDLYSLPTILMIHLKRFRYAQGIYSVQRKKINTFVSFPINELNLSEFLIGTNHNYSTIYDLYGISEHSGELGSGHYTAKAMNPINKKWYNFNDSFVNDILPQDTITRQAYVLFYLRRDIKK